MDPTAEGTRGFQCYTLEDTYLGDEVKVKGQSCIPCGDYHVELRFSPKFQMDLPVIFSRKELNGLYIIESPEKKVRFDQCMFHSGNNEGDTEGCPLVGEVRAPDNTHIEYSRPALALFLQRIRAALGRAEAISLSIRLSTGHQFPQ